MATPSLSNLLRSNPQPETNRMPTADHHGNVNVNHTLPSIASLASSAPLSGSAITALHHHHQHQQQHLDQLQQQHLQQHHPRTASPITAPPPPLPPPPPQPQQHRYQQEGPPGPPGPGAPSAPAPAPAAPAPHTPTATSSSSHGGGPAHGTEANQAGRGHANNTSLYQCADCQRRYSRPEHLARHIQTHTLGKRFFCQVCGKAFARADLLKRHAANHDNDNDATKKRRRTASSPGAGRVSHACRPCAAARVKCEEIKPCKRCRNRNIKCEYASSEAGSAAAMHLLHLSANAHSHPSQANVENVPQASPSYASSQVTSSPTAAGYLPPQPRPPQPTALQQQIDSPSLTHSSSVKPEEGQLPTPDTVMDPGNPDQFPPGPGFDPTAGNVVDMAGLPFSDFLRDVLYEPGMNPARLAEHQGLAVLDFCGDTNIELNDIDFSILDLWNVDGMGGQAAQHQFGAGTGTGTGTEEAVDLSQMRQNLVKVWTDSPWRWHPNKTDSGWGEQSNLPVPSSDTTSSIFQESRTQLDRVVPDKLDQAGRDRILAIVLSTCKNNAMTSRVSSSFPTVEVLDTVVHIFLAAHLCQVSAWIHYPSFHMNQQVPEWLAVVAAGGAVLTPVQTLRKFGLALQEAVRVTIPARFEDNNVAINHAGLVQALVLWQDVGLWSGNRRKMEIAECHLAIPITMMRYRGKFQRSAYPVIVVDPADEGQVLEEKWKTWHERESWKRLVFHCYLREAQVSMTTLTNPSMSYSELTLPLPEAQELWFAKTAQEWKAIYLEKGVGQSKRPPSVGDLFRDISALSVNHQRLDVRYSISIYLHGFWSLILEYRHLSAVHKSRSYAANAPGNANLVLSSRHRELCQDLQNFQLMTANWHDMRCTQENLVMHILMMNLHVSLDDLQVFSGKEGEDQARKIYPVLQQWADSPEGRKAVWHAGQVLCTAKMFPQGHLKDFYAVGVHHAALALWTFGVVSRASRRRELMQPQYGYEHPMVYLDDVESQSVRRFIATGEERPVVRGPQNADGSASESFVEDSRTCMGVVQEILKANFPRQQSQEALPPIVENLCLLIKQLGNAALAVGIA